MLLNTALNAATTRQFWDTIFKILRVQQYPISSILSQSVHNIRFIECYLVPDYQEVDKYMCNEYALCSIHEPPSAHVRGLGLSAILLHSFSLMVCSQLNTWCQKFTNPQVKRTEYFLLTVLYQHL